ncbi:Clavaminate synthase-like protein [Hypoxylon sp. FL1857]|nr:Clavaminate synthase-like protein [Hypoxylon sp. FL1857]
MHRLARPLHNSYQAPISPQGPFRLIRSSLPASACLRHGAHSFSTKAPMMVPCLEAPTLNSARQTDHVREVSERLNQSGILKISLGFSDNDCKYLEMLLLSLHQHHGHQLPITHSASRGWFWDIRPSTTSFQTANCQARSETMKQFPWHTDCSFEDPPPRYFALQVLQPDRYGGGTLSILSVERLIKLLSPQSRAALMCPEYRITTPPEFVKDSTPQYIVGNLLMADKGGREGVMRFRGDILEPLTERSVQALNELKQVLDGIGGQSDLTVNLTSDDLPEKSIILIDNRRWLHSRTDVKDPERHLRRVRWDAVPFQSVFNES